MPRKASGKRWALTRPYHTVLGHGQSHCSLPLGGAALPHCGLGDKESRGFTVLRKKSQRFAQPWKSGHLWPRKPFESIRALAPVVVSDLPIDFFSKLFSRRESTAHEITLKSRKCFNGELSLISVSSMTSHVTSRARCFIATSLAVLLATATHASPVEHPGILHANDNCSACHAGKSTGKSVHSAMVIPCTVCHLADTRGDMTLLDLMMPREQICFACHQKSQQHLPVIKGACLDCHDAHSSARRMLLRKNAKVLRPE